MGLAVIAALSSHCALFHRAVATFASYMAPTTVRIAVIQGAIRRAAPARAATPRTTP
jgi:hypothetical protein